MTAGIFRLRCIREIKKMDFELNGNTYFVDLADERGWQVFVSTPDGARSVPVYDDTLDTSDELTVVVEDEGKRKIVN